MAISSNSKPVLGTDVKLHARPRRSPPTNAVLCPNSVFVTYVSSDHKVMDEAAIRVRHFAHDPGCLR